MGLEKKALTNWGQSAPTALLDAIWTGTHKANEPSRGHALTSGVVHGTGTGLSHAAGSMATLFLLDRLMEGQHPVVAAGTKMVGGLAGGLIGGRAIPAAMSAAVDKLRPSRSEGSERTASLKGGAMTTVQDLAKLALANTKKANGPECGDMSGSYGADNENRSMLTKRRGWEGGPSALEAATGPMGAAVTRFHDDPSRGILPSLADAGLGMATSTAGGVLGDMAIRKLTGTPAAHMGLDLPTLARVVAGIVGSNAANQLTPKLGAVKNALAKVAMAGADPLDSQAASGNDQGYLSQAHDFLAKKRGLLGGGSILQAGGEALGHVPGLKDTALGRLAGPAAAAYSRMMEPGQGWLEGIGQGAISGLGSAVGKGFGTGFAHSSQGTEGIDPNVLSQIVGNLGSLLGGNLKMGSTVKKANLTQPFGSPVKSQFTHDPMGEPMDMSAASQAGSMGTGPKKDAKAPDKADKAKKASDDDSTAMRSFMGTWNRSKDIHAKSAAYKGFMSRIGKYTSFE